MNLLEQLKNVLDPVASKQVLLSIHQKLLNLDANTVTGTYDKAFNRLADGLLSTTSTFLDMCTPFQLQMVHTELLLAGRSCSSIVKDAQGQWVFEYGHHGLTLKEMEVTAVIAICGIAERILLS